MALRDPRPRKSVSSILFLVASLEETSWEAGGVVEELRLACCGVVEAEGPRLAVALSRGRVLLVACCGAGPVRVVCKS